MARKVEVEIGINTKGANAAIDSLNKSFGGIKGTVFQFNQVMGAAQTAMAGLNKAWELGKFAEDAKKLGAVVDEALADKLQQAVGGTVTKLEAMKFAAKALTGEMKLTESQMVTVLKAADNLGDRGFGETTEIAEKLTDALRKGTTKALGEYGIQIDETKDKTLKFNESFAALGKIAEDETLAKIGEDAEQARVAFQDFVNSLKAGIGDIVNTLTANFGSAWEEFIGADRARGAQVRADRALDAALAEVHGFQRSNQARMAAMGYEPGFPLDESSPLFRPEGEGVLISPEQKADVARRASLKRKPKEKYPTGPLGDEFAGGASFGGAQFSEYEFMQLEQSQQTQYGSGFESMGVGLEHVNQMAADLEADRIREFTAEMDQLNATMQQATDYSGLFAEGMAAAVNAALSGGNVGKAVKNAIQQFLKMKAIESSVMALSEVGKGLAASAVGSPSAPLHFAAAGKLFASAAAAGVGSLAIGAIGGGGGGGAASSAGSSPGPAGGGFIPAGQPMNEKTTSLTVNVHGFVGDKEGLARELSKVMMTGRRRGVVQSDNRVVVFER